MGTAATCPRSCFTRGFRSGVLDSAQVSTDIKNLAVSLGYYDSLFDYVAIYEMCML